MLLCKHTVKRKDSCTQGRPSLARPSKAQSIATLSDLDQAMVP